MLLIVSFGALAGLYVLLDAPFIAVTQIIIYAGAIMVLFLFVVMLLNVQTEEPTRAGACSAPPGRGGSARAALGGPGRRVVWALSRVGGRRSRTIRRGRRRSARCRDIGTALFTTSLVRVRSDVDSDSGGDGRRRLIAGARREH